MSGSNPTMESTLSNLSISQQSQQSTQRKEKKSSPRVAESWDDDSGSESDGDGPSTPTGPSGSRGLQSASLHAQPNAPPPTPASPSARFDNPYALPAEFPAMRERDGSRPEKTTSTASRMIAGALGVRAPRKGEEMKQYEAAAVEKERARKDRERAEREEAERRKKSVWED